MKSKKKFFFWKNEFLRGRGVTIFFFFFKKFRNLSGCIGKLISKLTYNYFSFESQKADFHVFACVGESPIYIYTYMGNFTTQEKAPKSVFGDLNKN